MPKAKMIWLVSLIGGILVFAGPSAAGLLRGTHVSLRPLLHDTSLISTPADAAGRISQYWVTPLNIVHPYSSGGSANVVPPLFADDEDYGVGGYVTKSGHVVRQLLITRSSPTSTPERLGRGPMPSFGLSQQVKAFGDDINPIATLLARLKKRRAEVSAQTASSGSQVASDEQKPANVISHDRPSKTPKPASPHPRASSSNPPGIISRSYQSVADPNTSHFITGTPAEVDKFIREKQKEDAQILKERESRTKTASNVNKSAGASSPASAAVNRTLEQIAREDAEVRAKWQERDRQAANAEAESQRQAQESARQHGTKSNSKTSSPKTIPPSDGAHAPVGNPVPASAPVVRTSTANDHLQEQINDIHAKYGNIWDPKTQEDVNVIQQGLRRAEINVHDRQYSDAVEKFSDLRSQGRYDEAAKSLEQAYTNSAYTNADNIKERMSVIEGLARTLPTDAVSKNQTLSHVLAPQPTPQQQQQVPMERLTPQQMEEQSRQEREAIAEALRHKAPDDIPANAPPSTQLLAMANVNYSRPEVLLGTGPNVGQTRPMISTSASAHGGAAKPFMPASSKPSSGGRSLGSSQVAAIKAKEASK